MGDEEEGQWYVLHEGEWFEDDVGDDGVEGGDGEKFGDDEEGDDGEEGTDEKDKNFDLEENKDDPEENALDEPENMNSLSVNEFEMNMGSHSLEEISDDEYEE